MEQPPARERPIHVSAGAGVLIGLGSFVLAVGLALAAMAALALNTSSIPPWVDLPPESFFGVAAPLGGAVMAYGLAQLITAAQVLRGRPWAAVAGIILSMIGAFLAVLGLLRGFGAEATGVTTIFLPVALAYVYSAWAFAAHPGWFGGG
jgi:hypothetical protein